MIPNECIYEILLLSNPKCLHLCAQLNNNFNELCQLESLWRNHIDSKYNELFKKENYYENCKMYYQLLTLKSKLQYSNRIEDLYVCGSIDCYYNKKLTQLPTEIKLLINMKHLGFINGRFEMFPLELKQLPNLRSIYIYSSENRVPPVYFKVKNFTDTQDSFIGIPNLFIYRYKF